MYEVSSSSSDELSLIIVVVNSGLLEICHSDETWASDCGSPLFDMALKVYQCC